MIIIDEKGRLFGKINLIDFLVIIFLFSLTPMFYLGYKIFIKKTVAETAAVVEKPKKHILELVLVFDLVNLSPDITELISVGDKEFNADGQAIGEIIKLDGFSPQVYKIDMGDGQKISEEDHMLKHAFAALRIKAELVQNSIYYNNRQIKSNAAIDFVTDKYKIQAVYLPTVSPETLKEIQPEEAAGFTKEDILKMKNDIGLLKAEVDSLSAKLQEGMGVRQTKKER